MIHTDLVLGVDGGGSKTVAWLAPATVLEGRNGELAPVGAGSAGPSNVEREDPEHALAAVDRAVDAAFAAAGRARAPVAAACIALAGAGSAQARLRVQRIALDRGLAERADRLVVVHDAEPVLACAQPAADVLALVSGTGSIAFGRDHGGRTARAGGHGAFLGDEGSAYAIARSALRALARAEDRRTPSSTLRELLFAELRFDDVRQLVRWCRSGEDVAAIAALAAPVDLAAERGDAVARDILNRAGADLAALALTVAEHLGFRHQGYTLCLAGSTLLSSATLRQACLQSLETTGFAPRTSLSVPDPVAGCVRIARLAGRGEFPRAGGVPSH